MDTKSVLGALKSIMRKHRHIFFGLCAVLLVVQFGTYFWYASDIIPRTGIRNLRDYRLLETTRYVVIDPDSWRNYSDGQKTNLLAEISRFTSTIYYSIDQVPEEMLIYEPIPARRKADYEEYKKRNLDPALLEKVRREIAEGRQLAGLEHGIKVRCDLESQGIFWMKCKPHHWVSVQGAEGRSDLYVWFFGSWLRIWNYYNYMS